MTTMFAGTLSAQNEHLSFKKTTFSNCSAEVRTQGSLCILLHYQCDQRPERNKGKRFYLFIWVRMWQVCGWATPQCTFSGLSFPTMFTWALKIWCRSSGLSSRHLAHWAVLLPQDLFLASGFREFGSSWQRRSWVWSFSIKKCSKGKCWLSVSVLFGFVQLQRIWQPLLASAGTAWHAHMQTEHSPTWNENKWEF